MFIQPEKTHSIWCVASALRVLCAPLLLLLLVLGEAGWAVVLRATGWCVPLSATDTVRVCACACVCFVFACLGGWSQDVSVDDRQRC